MKSFFSGKKILITGHTGFKGSWLTLWLNSLGAKVTGLALDPKTENDAFFTLGIANICDDQRVDIRNYEMVLKVVTDSKPEIVFHLAAQPLVLESYKNPLYTYETNIMGTANLLEAIRNTGTVKQAIMITTDKVYENQEFIWGYRENDKLGGYEPYGTSKAAAEMVIAGYRNSFFLNNKQKLLQTSVASVRAGNVIGGGDWSENRIIPDCIKAIENTQPIEIRNPNAIRPWQHVLEALGGYLYLCEKMANHTGKFEQAWNFGPGNEGIKTVKELVNRLIIIYGGGEWFSDEKEQTEYEAHLLALDISKATTMLGWKPLLAFDQTLEWTVNWYKAYREKKNMVQFSLDQINRYSQLMDANFQKQQCD